MSIWSNVLDFIFGRSKKVPERKTELDYVGLFGWRSYTTGVKRGIKKPNVEALRRFATQAIPRRAIDEIKLNILKRDWKITNVIAEDKKEYAKEKEIISSIINNPNDFDDYDSFWGAWLEDLITGDCGVFEKVRDKNIDRPLWLYTVDGFSIEMVKADLNNKGVPLYAQRQGANYEYFTNNELAYVKLRNFTHTPFGLGTLEAAFHIVAYLLDVQEYANNITNKAIPKFILNLGKSLDPKTLDDYRKYFEESIYGTGDIPIIAGDGVDTKQLGAINDDGTFLGYQRFLITIIAATFGLPAGKLGMEVSNDKSTIAEKNDDLLESAVKPYARKMERAINSHIIKNLGMDKFIKFQFVFEESLDQKKTQAEMNRSDLESDAITLDEYRAMRGLPPMKNEYGSMTISKYKAKLNEEHAVNNGGFNGVGKDRYADPKKGGEKE